MKNKKLIGVAFVVLALALVGTTAAFAAPSDANANIPIVGNRTSEEGPVISTSSAIFDPSVIIPDMPSNGVVMVEAHAVAADGTVIDPSNMSDAEGTETSTGSASATMLDASGNEVDVPLSGVPVLSSSTGIVTPPTK